MRIVMTLLVRDEADIIRQNVDFHLSRGVDFIIAMDNLSEDETPAILRDYERQGRLRYLLQEEDDYSQGRWVTRMARLAAAEHGADWVINGDADEFWWPQGGDLKMVLAAVPADVPALLVPRTNFVLRATAPEADFAEAMTLREVRSVNAFGRPLPPKALHRAHPEIEVSQGNHGVALDGVPLPTSPVAIEILHFPVRSYAHFVNKIAKGGAAYERNTDLNVGVGRTWRKLYEQWKAGDLRAYFDGLVVDEEAAAIALSEGTLVHDLRLRDALRELAAGREGQSS
jgi:hypothetical protein